MRLERPSGIVELQQQLRKELKPHEQYNTRHEIPPVSAHLCPEIRRKPCSRKYNKSRSYIYFWLARYDGSLHSLACQSRRPHSHSKQHTQKELKLISDMHRRNPKLEIVELWVRLRKRGYTRTIESLWRVMRREGWLAKAEKKKPYKPKPYE